MTAKRVQFVIQGMNRDLSESVFSTKFSYENKNLRLLADDSNDTLSLVNEKGTAPITISWDSTNENASSNYVLGMPIGQEIIDNELILFTSKFGNETDDRIYKFWFDSYGVFNGRLLFEGDLGFDPEHPIESISIYESEHLKKVYWTDGLNQPRLINIAATLEEISSWTSESFDFIPNLKLDEEIHITKNMIAGGVFPAGVLQYSFSYYNLYGQETNIFYTSPLYYTSFADRGGPADATVSNSFEIDITGFDRSFDYLRIYATLRTSLDATPQARRVADIPIKGIEEDTEVPHNVHHLHFIDTGTSGESIDPSTLLFIGGEDVFAETLEHKDNTLFLGNIGIRRPLIPESIKTDIKEEVDPSFSNTKSIYIGNFNGYYTYKLQLDKNSEDIKTFKSREWYRFGLQFQYKNGKWSEPVFIKDVYNDSAKNYLDEGYNTIRLVTAIGTLPASVVNALINEGYVKYRGVVVYPTINDRECVCQGVLNPTVYNAQDRWFNSPFAQASWFFRPMSGKEHNGSPLAYNVGPFVNSGYAAEFRHNYALPNNIYNNCEIQCMGYSLYAPSNPYIGNNTNNLSYGEEWVAHYREWYFVDQSIFTLNSPDIEFNNEIAMLNGDGLKLRIVGLIPLDSCFSDINILTDTPPNNLEIQDLKKTAVGFYKENISTIGKKNAWKSMISAPFWLDVTDDNSPYGTSEYKKVHCGFVVYPWNKTGALNNCGGADESGYIASKLKNKVMSIFRYSNVTKYLDNVWEAETDNFLVDSGISGVKFFNSDVVSMVKVKSQSPSKFNDIFYYGNIDKVILPQSSSGKNLDHGDILVNKYGGYPITMTIPYIVPGHSNYDEDFHNLFTGQYTSGRTSSESPDFAQKWSRTNPVSMKYKSTPHAIIALNHTIEHEENGQTVASQQRILPTISRNGTPINSGDGALPQSTDNYDLCAFWDKNRYIHAIHQDSIEVGDDVPVDSGFLWVGELYNDTVTEETRFGGNTDEAIANNKWEPCGEPVKLTADIDNSVAWTEGDTYYQRYDCLKTYPFTKDDENSIVDILSFMCETRINIDGRYDRSRGLLSNLHATPETHNLLNKVYSQRNNFFEYRITDPNLLIETKYSNIITWGKTKTLGETVDQWANVVLASTLELDGSCGKVTSLNKLNNNLIAFQDKGISQILYNDNVQIASTSGVPIEIANSGKVQGKRYISSSIGCSNKWSIGTSPNGLYFVDSINKDIYLFDGTLHNISDKFGFHSWTATNFKENKLWNPKDFDACITHYEPINGDVFFILKNSCLAYSEPLGYFSSFYDYENTPYLSILDDSGIWWHYDSTSNKYKPYLHRKGEYNKFFGVYKPYWTTVITNPNEPADKIFNILEFRADGFTKDSVTNKYNVYSKDHIFDTLRVWTEYQEGVSDLTDVKDYPSTLKKKFRIWRALIPRNNTNKFGDNLNNYSRDRIRNPWAYVKLGMEKSANYSQDKKVILHDLIIDYFE